MRVCDFNYHLPAGRIARQPACPRDASRLLCLGCATGCLTDDVFSNITRHLRPGDLLVFNDTKVIPARLFGRKASGGRVEILIERLLDENTALAQLKASKPARPGTVIWLAGATGGAESGPSSSLQAGLAVLGRNGQFYRLQTLDGAPIKALWQAWGHVPLPPYIRRTAAMTDRAADKIRYQTVYARCPGAVAAPTAGLHFTPALMRRIASEYRLAYLTLHIGAGTFQPLRVTDVRDHQMHSEWFTLGEDAAAAVNETRASGGRVIAVGTTALRALEAAARVSQNAPNPAPNNTHNDVRGQLRPQQGETDIFIYPGFDFKVVDALITNFHLPRSSLLLLVSAFAGRAAIMDAYCHAIRQGYRFYSYGDAMFIY